MSRATLLLLLMVGLVSAATCETDLIDDPGFQLWCGEQLCAWDLEEGEIRKVPTWHDHDYGVELVGSRVLLSQGARSSASCVRVEVTSQIELGAMVTVEVDADGDGAVDWTVPIASSERFVSRAQGAGRRTQREHRRGVLSSQVGAGASGRCTASRFDGMRAVNLGVR